MRLTLITGNLKTMTTSMTIHKVTEIEKKLEHYKDGYAGGFTTLTITATNEDGEKFEIHFFLSSKVPQQLPKKVKAKRTQLLNVPITDKV